MSIKPNEGEQREIQFIKGYLDRTYNLIHKVDYELQPTGEQPIDSVFKTLSEGCKLKLVPIKASKLTLAVMLRSADTKELLDSGVTIYTVRVKQDHIEINIFT